MAEPASKLSNDYSKLIRDQTRTIDLDTFRERGVKKVSVINAKKINELITQAVESTIQRLENADVRTLREDKAQVILDSMNEFKRLMAEQQKEPEKVKADENVAMSGIEEGLRDIKAAITNLQAKAAQEQFTRQALIEEQRATMQEQFHELKSLMAQEQQNAEKLDHEEKQLNQVINGLNQIGQTVNALASRNGNAEIQKSLDQLNRNLGDNLGASMNAIKGEMAALRVALESALDSKLATKLEAERKQMGAVLNDIKVAVEASGRHAAASQGQNLAALEEKFASVAAALQEMQTKPSSVDPAALELIMKTSLGAMKQDMMRDFEKSGLVKSGAGMDGVDTTIASAVVNSVFKNMDATESHLGNVAKTQTAEGGGKALSALEKLKQMKKPGGAS